MRAEIPRAWCEACSVELRPFEVLLGRCPHCGEPMSYVVVDRDFRTAPTAVGK